MSVAFERGYEHGIKGGEAAECPYAGRTVGSAKLRGEWFDGFDDGSFQRCLRQEKARNQKAREMNESFKPGKFKSQFKRGEYFRMRLAQIKAEQSAAAGAGNG